MAHNDRPSRGREGIAPRAEETRRRILEAAGDLFAEHGYARVSTRAIAANASVNEVTLFRQFGSKEALFTAVIDELGGPAVAADLAAQFTGDYARDMLVIGTRLMDLLLQRRGTLRLMLCEGVHFRVVQAAMEQNPRQLRNMLSGYFQQQIGLHAVRPLQPEAMAQAFLGMFFTVAVLQAFLGEDAATALSAEDLTAEFVDIFVRGTATSPTGD